MTQEQFIYWLQGKLEGRNLDGELKEIQDHLKTVFHKVTPLTSYTFPNQTPPTNDPWNPTNPRIIC